MRWAHICTIKVDHYREIFTESLQRSAIAARDRALGPRRSRTRSHAIVDRATGAKVGGTAWERSLKGAFKAKRGRCYPFGCTYQKQKSLYSPCAAGKLSVADEDTLEMRKDLTEASARPMSVCVSHI